MVGGDAISRSGVAGRKIREMMDATTKLGTLERTLLMALAEAGVNVDVDIDVLWDKMYPERTSDNTDGRVKQQYVGGCVSRINRKLRGQAVEPGRLKHTYRLTDAKA